MGGEEVIDISSDSSDEDHEIDLIDWDVTLTRHKASGSQALVVTILCLCFGLSCSLHPILFMLLLIL